MKFIILSAALTAAMVINTTPAGAWSYPGTGNMGVAVETEALPGDPVNSVDARTLGMSGSSLASSDGVNGIFYNPANLALGSMKAISLGLYSNHSSEMDLAEKEYTSSTLYKGPVFGVMFPLSGLRLGFGYRESFDMGYYHDHKEFTDGNADTFKTDISGGQRDIIIAAALRLLGGLHTGFSYNIVGGGLEGTYKETYYETSRKEKDIERTLSGGFMELGFLYKIDRDLAQVGFSWAPGYTIEDKWSSDTEQYYWDSIADDWGTPAETSLEGSRDVKMPSTMGLGIQYNFLGLDRTMITADVKRTMWSNYRYEETDEDAAGYEVENNPDYRDTIRFSVGAEHYVNYLTAVRMGFAYEPFYGSTAVDMTSFSAGVGRDIGQDLSIDVGGMLGYRTYYGDNPFSDDDANISEKHIKLMASMELLF